LVFFGFFLGFFGFFWDCYPPNYQLIKLVRILPHKFPLVFDLTL
jgi:hypothetical protein